MTNCGCGEEEEGVIVRSWRGGSSTLETRIVNPSNVLRSCEEDGLMFCKRRWLAWTECSLSTRGNRVVKSTTPNKYP